MADKPSRGLVIYGDGMARFIEQSFLENNLNSFASLSSCGFLSLPHSPPSESEEGRTIREFAELVDSCEAYNKFIASAKEDGQEKPLMPTISERFMGMRAAIVTNNSSLKSLGGKLGFTILQSNKLIDDGQSFAESLLKLLGFQEGKTLDMSQYDLVFVHVGAREEINSQTGVEYVNALVGGIMQKAQPGSEIACRLHASIVLSYGAVTEDDDPSLSVLTPNPNNKSDISLLFPRQSYTVKGGNPRKNVRHHSPMLIAQWQSGVTRKDMVEKFSFKDFKEVGANLAIPADRFIHEIAFKLWKAPKYGA
ncbi:hypothetical protein LguiA_017988 [Lonicera macranthoides]